MQRHWKLYPRGYKVVFFELCGCFQRKIIELVQVCTCEDPLRNLRPFNINLGSNNSLFINSTMWEKLDFLCLIHRFSGAKSETRRGRKGGGWGADLFKIPPRSQTEERESWEHGTNMQWHLLQLSEVSTRKLTAQPRLYSALNKRSFECMLNSSNGHCAAVPTGVFTSEVELCLLKPSRNRDICN